MSPVRILVADDHPAMCLGMKAIISSMKPEAALVGQAADGEEAIARYKSLRPDLMSLDLRMPGLDGPRIIERVLELDPGAKILVMTVHELEEDIFRSFEAGATGYILKSAPRREIIEAIRMVSHGERYVPGPIALKLASRAASAALTSREAEVLGWMRLGLTNKEISEALRVAEGTVKTHVKVLFTKLGAANRTEAVKVAAQRGILR